MEPYPVIITSKKDWPAVLTNSSAMVRASIKILLRADKRPGTKKRTVRWTERGEGNPLRVREGATHFHAGSFIHPLIPLGLAPGSQNRAGRAHRSHGSGLPDREGFEPPSRPTEPNATTGNLGFPPIAHENPDCAGPALGPALGPETTAKP